MTELRFHVYDHAVPDRRDAGRIDVLLYGPRPVHPGTGSIGHTLEAESARLGVRADPAAFDFLSIALAVTAADTFVNRDALADNAWVRSLDLDIPVARPDLWRDVARPLEKALGFLSGDLWSLSFRANGKAAPSIGHINRLRRHIDLNAADAVCLFSGGLDSMIGASELIREGHTPLLVSHAYRGDKSYQAKVAPRLGRAVPRFSANANPVFHRLPGGEQNDTTMRTRSLNFLAFGALCATALCSIRPRQEQITLHVPENGLIALNAPLTRRRIGSHSTRTTHPHFLNQIQSVFDAVGIPVRLENRYRHMTKGEMLARLAPDDESKAVALATVSCGKWKHKSLQCGHCVPCLIRGAAFYAAGIEDTTRYQYTLPQVWEKPDIRDDLIAMLAATAPRVRSPRHYAISSGPLPEDRLERDGWFGVLDRGLREVGAYLDHRGFPV